MLYSKIEGSGKPLLILHGFLGMSDNWKTIGTQIGENGFQVHLLDLRNHGRSFHSDEFSYEVMAEDILAYCQFHRLKKIDMIGHSMGGKVAMFLATKYPTLIEKLIVADIGPKYYKPHHQEIVAGLNAVDFSKKPERSDVDEILKKQIPDFGTRQFLMKSLFWKEPGQLAFRFNLAVFNQKIEEVGTALPDDLHFDKATLFIHGGNSRYILEEDKAAIIHHFPMATFKTIPNAGHWLHAEKPELFYKIAFHFLVA
jgi:pimeloyl-ACP methyl ester carboxylesterase